MAPHRYIRLHQEAQTPLRTRPIRFPLNTSNGRDLAEGHETASRARLTSIRARSEEPSEVSTERSSSRAPHSARHTRIAPMGRALATTRRSRSPPRSASRCNGTINCGYIAPEIGRFGLVRRHGAGAERGSG